MRHFVLPPEYTAFGRHTLSGENFHYLCRVRRYAAGDLFDATDGSGGVYRCSVLELTDSSCTIEVAAASAGRTVTGDARAPQQTVTITLFQALPKGRKLEQIIRQTTETGVARIVPFSSRFCVAEAVSGQRLYAKLQRWRTIARQAVQQCGSTLVPAIEAPIELEQIPAVGGAFDLGLLFHQQPLAQQTLHGYLEHGPQRVAIVIGAEGGLADEEIDFLCRARGFHPAHLGPTVLRSETAALYAVAAVQTIVREIETWSKS